MLRNAAGLTCLVLMVAVLCLCTQLSPNTLKMISFSDNSNPPSAPVIKSAIAGVGSITVSWDTVSGAQSYNLFYHTGPTVDTTTGTKMAGVTSPVQIPGLTNDTQYAIAVCAANASGESGPSNTVTAIPQMAPSISTQPQSQTATVGQNVTFSIAADGTAPLSYQWKKNDSVIVGATKDSLSLATVQNSNSGAYTVVVSNAAGSIVSNAATLTVTAAAVSPSIATQPASQTAMAGSRVTFTVVATGTGPLIYKWKKNGATLADSTSNSYTIASVANSDAGTYSVVVSNSVGNVVSLDAVLTITSTPVAPTITTQPQSQTITVGQTVTFSVAATGTGLLAYQWKKDTTTISGATSSTYSITNVQSGNAGKYSVLVSDSVGKVLSDSAVLTVTAAPVAPSISTQPLAQTVIAGQNVTLSVIAGGTAPFTYQWKKDTVSISGATSSSLFLSGVQAASAGTYTVVVSNAVGSVVSNGALLTVNDAPTTPSITTQPKSQSVTAGQSVTFSVAAIGTPPLSYQWKRNGALLAGDTASSFTISAVAVSDTGSYTLTVTNNAGNAVSIPAVLTVTQAPVAPNITTQPASDSAVAGQTVTFSVVATGTAPLVYQWYVGSTAISGATSSSYVLPNVQIANAGTYTVVVSNGTLPNATSSGAVLAVSSAAVAPSITAPPKSDSITAGQSVTFTATATGTAPLSYQWYLGGTAISGATSSSYSIQNAQAANAGTYTVTVSNGTLPNATSSGAVLVVNPPPVAPSIATQPPTQTVTAGQNVTFTVAATGTAPLAYQWYLGAAVISGATSASYTISNVQASNAGTYTVTVSNGTLPNATSTGAVLTVNPAPVAPSITTQPLTQTVTAGQNVAFTVAATGTAPLAYQWYLGAATISGATSASYAITNVQSANAGTYTVTVSNGTLPNATSTGAVLTVNPAPVAPSITTQPLTQTVTAGQNVTFTVVATGTAPLAYQWYLGAAAISGATSASYAITSVQSADAGTYTVTVSNGTLPNATSTGAALTVNPAPVAPSITTQPLTQTVTAGQNVTFTVVATGTAPLAYQWYLGAAAISGAISASYAITSVQSANAGTYSVTVSNGTLPNATSTGAVLTVNPTAGTVLDTDGNIYHTVTIGTQVWMVENLKTTRYNDGTSIPLITDASSWSSLASAGFSRYNNDSTTYGSTYGALYNWYAVNTGKLAPAGWHVPTDAEWAALDTYLGGDAVAGGTLKEAGTTHWLAPNTGATNSSGFFALPGGYRSDDGTFNSIGYGGVLWSSSANDAASSWSRSMSICTINVLRYNYLRGYGLSVRCIKN